MTAQNPSYVDRLSGKSAGRASAPRPSGRSTNDYYRCFDCGASWPGPLTGAELPGAAVRHRDETGHLRFEVKVK